MLKSLFYFVQFVIRKDTSSAENTDEAFEAFAARRVYIKVIGDDFVDGNHFCRDGKYTVFLSDSHKFILKVFLLNWGEMLVRFVFVSKNAAP